MHHWDDAIAEEKNVQNQEVLASLQQLYHAPTANSPLPLDEQKRILERVQTRLAGQNFEYVEQISALEITDLPHEQAKITQMFSSPSRTWFSKTGIQRVYEVAVAVLLAAVLIGGVSFLFTHAPEGTGTSAGTTTSSLPNTLPVGPPIVAKPSVTIGNLQALGGIVATMKFTSGPYFVSELLEVDLYLTNNTKTTLQLQGIPQSEPCYPALHTSVIGGTTPYFDVSVKNDSKGCPAPEVVLVSPGQTLHVTQDVVIVASGEVKLAFGAEILNTTIVDKQGKSMLYAAVPGANIWPETSLTVAGQIPSNRLISLQWHGPQVTIETPSQDSATPRSKYAPTPASTNLRYVYECQQSMTSKSPITIYEVGYTTWNKLEGTTLNASKECPSSAGTKSEWTFSVGAPGYSVVNGSYDSK